jgi:hypothetical protein
LILVFALPLISDTLHFFPFETSVLKWKTTGRFASQGASELRKVAVQQLVLLLRVQDVPASNIDQETGHPSSVFVAFAVLLASD